MADVTNELMLEVLKRIQEDMSELKQGQRDANARLNALGTHLIGLQQDINAIYSILSRQDTRLERIERRLELTDAPVP